MGSETSRTTKRAQCIAQSWLKSWGIPHELRGDGLVVDGVVVGPTPEADHRLDVSALTGKDHSRSMAEMGRLMKRLGRLVPDPQREPVLRFRAEAGDTVARSLRIRAFSMVPDPSPEDVAKFYPTVKREADCAYRRYQGLVERLMLERQDVLNAGLVYLFIFLHRYRDPCNDQAAGAELTLYLRQEFRLWARVQGKDAPERNLDPTMYGCLTQLTPFGTPVNFDTWHRNEDDTISADPSYVMPEYAEVTPGERLKAKLTALPHQKFVKSMKKAMKNRDSAVRELAQELFEEHCAECVTCT